MINNKKGALELSLNFLVGFIFGILLLTLGLTFTYKLIKGANDFMQPPNNWNRYVEECVELDKSLCVPIFLKEIPSSEGQFFGLIINNNKGESHRFVPRLKFAGAILDDKTELSSDDIILTEWTEASLEEVTILNDDDYTVDIPIKVPEGTKTGTYIFNVHVCYDGATTSAKCPGSDGINSLYDETHQIKIKVI